MNIREAIDEIQVDIDEVNNWADEEYNKYFGNTFSQCLDVYETMQSKGDKISDDLLEWVLTAMPFELIGVSAKLSKLQTALEVAQIHSKEKHTQIVDHLTSQGLTKTEAKLRADNETQADKLLARIYQAMIKRVEHEMTFSRELIMSCKKIWDSRRNSEVNPGGLTESELPEYKYEVGQTYIK